MKIKTTAVVIVSSMGFASGYTVSVTNETQFSAPSLPIVDNTGSPLASGTFAVGFFGSDAAVTGNADDFAVLLGGFTEYGTSVAATSNLAPGLFTVNAPPEWTVSVPSGTTGGQVGSSVYVIFGEGSSLAVSNTLAVWKSDSVFGTEDDSGQGTVAVDLATGLGTLLLGDDTGPTDIGVVYDSNITLVEERVPEPSTSLLAGLAGLGLAFRRRR